MTNKINIDEDGKLLFGEYPQSKYKAEVPSDINKDEKGYYIVNDLKLVLHNKEYYIVEPIAWTICYFDNNYSDRAVLISDCILDSTIFSKEETDYTRSKLRQMLNGTFLDKAFNEEELSSLDKYQMEIQESFISNPIIKDLVFAVDTMEIEWTECQEAYLTDYSIATGCKEAYKGTGYFWLRNKAFGMTMRAAEGNNITCSHLLEGVGLRPCILLKGKKEKYGEFY